MHYRIACLLAAFTVCLSLPSRAQVEQSRPRLIPKVNLGALVHSYHPSLVVGVEYRVSDYIYVQPEVGWIYTLWTPAEEDLEKRRGFQTNLQAKWYPDGFQWSEDWMPGQLYFFVEAGYWFREEQRRRVFCREDCNYFQLLTYQSQLRQWNAMIGMGQQFETGFDRLFVDVGIAVGRAFFQVDWEGVPEDASLQEGDNPISLNFNTYPEGGGRNSFRFACTLKLGYWLQ